MLSVLLLNLVSSCTKSYYITGKDRLAQHTTNLNKGQQVCIEILESSKYLLFSDFDKSLITAQYHASRTSPTIFARQYESNKFTTPFLDYSNYTGKVTITAHEDTLISFAAFSPNVSCYEKTFVTNAGIDVTYSMEADENKKLPPGKSRCIFISSPATQNINFERTIVDTASNVNPAIDLFYGGKQYVHRSTGHTLVENVRSMIAVLKSVSTYEKMDVTIKSDYTGKAPTNMISTFLEQGETQRTGDPTPYVPTVPPPSPTPSRAEAKTGLTGAEVGLIVFFVAVVVVGGLFVAGYFYMRRGYTFSDDVQTPNSGMKDSLLEGASF